MITGQSLSFSGKPQIVSLLLALASFAGAEPVTVSGSGLKFTGKLAHDLRIEDSYDVEFLDFDANGHKIWIDNVTQLYAKRSKFTGLDYYGAYKATFQDSDFNGQGLDQDACMVGGRQQKVSQLSYLDNWWYGKPRVPETLRYGRPDAFFARPGVEWHKTVSDRTGLEIWKGIDPQDLSRNIKFLNCTFHNAKRAGLFLHHLENALVEGCEAWGTGDYPLGGENIKSTVWRRNKASQIVSHYYNISSLYEENEVTWGINIYSQGDPVKNLIIRKNKSFSDQKDGGRIMLRNGQFFGWSAGAWFEDVHITENEANYVFVAAGDFQGKPTPEIMPRNIFITNNNLKGGTYPAEIHLQSVDGYLLEGNTGKVRDYTAGGRVPSRPLVSDPAG